MNKFIESLNEAKIPATIIQMEMNTNTSDKLIRTIPTSNHIGKVGYLCKFTGIPVIINEAVDNGKVKILYSDGKYTTISSIESTSIYKKEEPFKMEYDCEWFK